MCCAKQMIIEHIRTYFSKYNIGVICSVVSKTQDDNGKGQMYRPYIVTLSFVPLELLSKYKNIVHYLKYRE